MEKFIVELDGVEKEASLIKVVNLDGKDYAVYSIEEDDVNSGVYASKIEKDDFGNKKLIDIEDEKIKQNIAEIIGLMLS